LFICELRSFLNGGGTRNLHETKEMAHQYIVWEPLLASFQTSIFLLQYIVTICLSQGRQNSGREEEFHWGQCNLWKPKDLVTNMLISAQQPCWLQK